MQEGRELSEKVCIHHWLINMRPVSGLYYGVCKKCGTERMFNKCASGQKKDVLPSIDGTDMEQKEYLIQRYRELDCSHTKLSLDTGLNHSHLKKWLKEWGVFVPYKERSKVDAS